MRDVLTCCDSTEEYQKLFERVHQIVYKSLSDLPDKALQVREAVIGVLESEPLTTILH